MARALAAAVLRQTIADATKNRPARPGGWTLTNRVRREALFFAFSPDPATTLTRVMWCKQAGIHPERLRAVIERDCLCLIAGAKRISRTGAVDCESRDFQTEEEGKTHDEAGT